MGDPTRRAQWLQAARDEIKLLEEHGTWVEVPIEEATSRVIPGLWIFRIKRAPDGSIKKYKARYTFMGNFEEDDGDDNYAPVVSWTSVRMFMVLSLILGWVTNSVDFSGAFTQAFLKSPMWMHLPRGFCSSRKGSGKTCLRLVRSIYGSRKSPRLWFEYLTKALHEMGFKSCAGDPCFLYRAGIMIVVFVDDLGIGACNQRTIDDFVGELRARGFNLTHEGSFSEFLGIDIQHDAIAGTFTMTQPGLIQKILDTTNMNDCRPIATPASTVPAGLDPDGAPINESWNYRSIIGMLLYLSTNTRPDISYAVSIAARFSTSPKQSHAGAVKRIIRYLKGTIHNGMIMQPSNSLTLSVWADADFCGLHAVDPPDSPSSARSRTGYISFLSNCPLTWRTVTQSDVALSTGHAEYTALSAALRDLLGNRELLIEMTVGLNVLTLEEATIHATAFEDNSAALTLANTQRTSPRTRWYNTKLHWFWDHVRSGVVRIVKETTDRQRADYLTKGCAREIFERVRKMCQGW